jgi:hypothetical protein
MSVTTISCPSCEATLKSAAPITIGKTIKCPKCGANFRVPPEGEAEVKPRPGKTAPERAPEADEDERDEGRPRPRKTAKKKSTAKKAKPILIWGLAGGALALALLILGIGGALWGFGVIGGKGSAGKTGDQPGTTTGAGTIELSSPEAEIIGENVQGQDLVLVHWKVKYRFTEGQPQPATFYACECEYSTGGVAHKEIMGRDLKTEGVFEDKSAVFAKQQPPKTVKFHTTHAPGKGGPYRTNFNEVSCPAKPGVGYIPEIPKATAEQNKAIDRLTTLGAEVVRFGDFDGSAVSVNFHGKKVGDTGATDGGVASLKDMTSLKVLNIGDNPGITDAGLVHLKGLTSLVTLRLVGTRVTDSGVMDLQKALPNVTIVRTEG